MSQHPERAVDYLEHISAALGRIQQYVAGMSKAQFMEITLVQDAVLRNLTILGEAAHKLLNDCPEFVTGHPEIPVARIYATRNRLTHGYEVVDLEVVWNLVAYDVPALEPKIEAALKELRGSKE